MTIAPAPYPYGYGAATTWRTGDIGAETNDSFLARLIQFGQWLRPLDRRARKYHRWNHVFVVTNDQGDTIEAVGRGVITSNVGDRDVINLGCPEGVDREAVVATARAEIGAPYSYLGVVLLGVDAVLGTRFHWHGRARFCSELGAQALKAGGWKCRWLASEIRPADLVDLLVGDVDPQPIGTDNRKDA